MLVGVTNPLNREEVPTDFEHLRRQVRCLTGIDLGAYKKQQLLRRLRSFVKRHQLSDFAALAKWLDNPIRLEEFKVYLTINVSEFFRNPQRFEELRTIMLPQLPPGALRVWSAGCANGAEPYTLAMLLRKERPRLSHKIWATDIDAPSLAKAEQATYTANDVRSVPPDVLATEFTVEQKNYVVRMPIRQLVTFKRHNLLNDAYLREMDMVVCRNVVIYFTDEARNRIFTGFRDSLKRGGILFVGSTETLFNPERFGFKQFKSFFYRAT